MAKPEKTDVLEDIYVGRIKELRQFVADSLEYFAAIESPEDMSMRRELDRSEEKAKRKVLALMECLAERGQELMRESADTIVDIAKSLDKP